MERLREAIGKGCRRFAEGYLEYSPLLLPHFVFHDSHHAGEVYRYSRSILEAGGRVTIPEDCAIYCAAYLHDIGLGFNPNEWESLGISREYVLKNMYNQKFRDYVRKLEYFKSGILSPSQKLNLLNLSDEERFKLVKAIRKLHPWISARLVELKLSNWLLEHEHINLPNQLVALLSDLCRLHSSKTSLKDYLRSKVEVWGLNVNVGLLAAALRLGDALDCTAGRAGSQVYEAYVRDIVKFDCSQLKHWVFKQYIEAVEISGRDIVIRMNTTKPYAIFGVALFELSQNIYEDYQAANEVFKDIKGVEFRLLLEVPGRGSAQLTEKDVEVSKELSNKSNNSSNDSNKKASQIFQISLESDCISDEMKKDLQTCNERLGKISNNTRSLDVFDVLAHLCSPLQGRPMGDPEGLVYYLDKKLGISSKLSSELRNLLQLH